MQWFLLLIAPILIDWHERIGDSFGLIAMQGALRTHRRPLFEFHIVLPVRSVPTFTEYALLSPYKVNFNCY